MHIFNQKLGIFFLVIQFASFSDTFFIGINSHPSKFIVGKTMFQNQNIIPTKAELENIHMHAYPLTVRQQPQ